MHILDVCKIGIDLIKLIEEHHKKGYVQCEIKVNNILVPESSSSDTCQLYLIDFGLATEYLHLNLPNTPLLPNEVDEHFLIGDNDKFQSNFVLLGN